MKNSGKRDYAVAGATFVALLAIAFGPVAFGKGASATAASRPGKTELRLCYFPNLTHAPALVGVARGTIAEALPDYNISTKVVNAGPEAMEALLAGAIDAAYVGPSPAVNTFTKTNGEALQIVAGACSGGASLIATPESGIHGVKDLAEHKVAVPQLGGTQDVSCRHFLAENGLTTKDQRGTVDIISAKNPDILALFKQKQIDAAWVPEPWASRLVAEAHGVRVVDERDLWPDRKFTTTVLVVGKKFAAAHPDAVAGLVKANAASIDWLNEHSTDGQKAANDELKRLSGKGLSQAVLKESWSELSFDTDPNLSSIRTMADAAHKAGYLKDEPRNLEAILAPNGTQRVAEKR